MGRTVFSTHTTDNLQNNIFQVVSLGTLLLSACDKMVFLHQQVVQKGVLARNIIKEEVYKTRSSWLKKNQQHVNSIIVTLKQEKVLTKDPRASSGPSVHLLFIEASSVMALMEG